MTTISVTDTAYQVAWEHLGLDRMPLALLVNPRGARREERDVVVAEAWQELRAAGLVVGANLDERLAHWLRMLAAPTRFVDARLWLGEEVRAVAATQGDDDAVLAVLRGGKLTLRPIFTTGLARAVTELLPVLKPGPGHSVSVPSAALANAAREAGSDPRALVTALGTEIATEDAEQLVQMIKDVGHRGQFGATVGRDRADRAVAYYDTPLGRYLMEDLRDWTTVSPADSRLLARQIDRLTTTAN
ncbi:ESX secretion-associated protein EspG [Allokutzneria oryzae]|uniref:ESX secretion-associated protein EspG n=1 Tax=Allokutzneria oryzae TaxID=1378989 RepID=A0ABV6A6M1_9PSEU